MTILKFVKDTCVALCTLFVLSSPSSAQPLTIHGVNAEMNYEEVVSALRARSRHCNEPVEREPTTQRAVPPIIAVYCWSDNIATAENSDIKVEATDRAKLMSISFYCTATRTCGLSVEEIISALVDMGVLPDGIVFKYSPRFDGDSFIFTDANENFLKIRPEYAGSTIYLEVSEEKYLEFDF